MQQTAAAPLSFEGYDLQLFDSFAHMAAALREKERQMELCRFCSGYGWKWVARKSPATADISIDGVDIWWNKQTKGWLRNPDAKQEMGSIYTLPGLDLNYAAVVIGPELGLDPKTGKLRIHKERYFDGKVKRDSSDEEIRQFILSVYGVLLTRGIYGTYLYVCDEGLRAYLKQYIPTATPSDADSQQN